MAIVPVAAFTPLTGTSQTSRVSGSFTPVAGELLVIAATARDAAALVTPVLTLTHSFGGTWSFTKETNDLTTQFVAHSIWFAIVPAGLAAGTITVTADRSCSRWRFLGLRFADHNGECPPANRRSNFTTSSATPTTSVPAAPLPTSCLCGIIASQGNVAPSINPGAGFTELSETGDASATIEEVEYNSAPTSATVDWSGCGTTGSRPFVFEVKAAPGNPVQLFAPFASGTTNSNTTPSFTPTAGDLILIAVSARQNISADPVPDFSISQTHAGTWSWTRYQASNAAFASVATVVAVFAAICPASPGAGTVTLDAGGAVLRWSVMGDAVPNGRIPSNWNHIDTIAGGTTFDLQAAPRLSSVAFGYIWVNLANPVVTPGAGWTEVRETGPAGSAATLEMEYRRNSISPTVNWADVSGAGSCVALGFEVPSSAPGGAAYSMAADAQAYAWTGVAARLAAAHRLPATPQSYAWAGVAARLAAAHRLPAAPAAYLWTGVAAASRLTRGLVAVPAVYNWSGLPTRLAASRRLAAAPQSYAWAGVAALFKLGRGLAAAPASFAVTPTTTRLAIGRRLAATPQAYLWTGVAAALKRGIGLVAVPASFVLTPALTRLAAQRRMPAAAQSYLLNPSTIRLAAARRLAAGTQGYIWLGVAAGGITRRGILAASGVFLVAPSTVRLTAGRRLQAATRGYLITPFDVNFPRPKKLSAETAHYLLVPFDVGLKTSIKMVASPASFLWVPQPAVLHRARRLAAAPASFSWVGVPIRFGRGHSMRAVTARYVWQGVNVSFGQPGIEMMALVEGTIRPDVDGQLQLKLFSKTSGQTIWVKVPTVGFLFEVD